jgi:hypothetical protein
MSIPLRSKGPTFALKCIAISMISSYPVTQETPDESASSNNFERRKCG